jgi:hypothetical protein
MALVPGNPVVGGTSLVRAAINSPNFDLANPSASPTPSWAVLQSGLAYLFGLVLSGGTFTIDNSHGAVIFKIDPSKDAWFLYADTGSAAQGALIASGAGAAGTNDGFGNSYIEGLASYVTLASGLGAGRYAVALADQGGPYAGFAALTFQNLTHPANAKPGVLSDIDPTQGTELELQSGKTASGDSSSVITMTDSHATNASIALLADALTIAPASSAAATGVDLTGYLVLGDQAASPASVIGAGIIHVDSVGFLRFRPDPNSGDTNLYSANRAMFSAAGQTINSTSVANVTGIAGIAVAATRYRVSGMISVTQGGTTAIQAFQLTSTAGNAGIRVGWFAVEGTAVEGSGQFAAMGTDMSFSFPNGSAAELFFEGIVSFSTSGVLNLVARCVTSAADTFVINSLSHMILERI